MNIEYCLLPSQNMHGLIDRLQRLDVTKRWKVEVKLWKSKRSLDQNRRYWELLNFIGKTTGYEAEELHDMMRFKFLRNAVEIEGEKLPLLRSTTKLTVQEFTEYMEAIERWAAGMGIVFENYS